MLRSGFAAFWPSRPICNTGVYVSYVWICYIKCILAAKPSVQKIKMSVWVLCFRAWDIDIGKYDEDHDRVTAASFLSVSFASETLGYLLNYLAVVRAI